ncbi:MerC domain-containing protein [Lentisphaera profundi]|uniref:MerC domain-containing protein n=1 Tax=Lentisphaera profundi TaxID=1658616 RepID=A0ABY7VRZ8_9BACT|nr:MerC domain-containing protein [Lentisphaera profundi]WDE95667.1 MerC domain-containing protein [Lentisphaera profundi]
MLKKLNADLIGSIASIICLIHCLFMPWILMFSGVWLSQYFSHPLFHHLMLIVALIIGIPVFLRSYFKYNSKLVLFLGIIGLSLTSYGTFRQEPCCPHDLKQNITLVECSDCDLIVTQPETKTDLPSFNLSSTQENIELEDNFRSVPLGVAFILLAHILNFKHRKKCKIQCCTN